MKTYKVEVYDNGDKHWFLGGKLHREDGPAIHTDGGKHWFLGGKLHREDGPAIEYADGGRYWYLNGQLHREDGPACEYANGDRFWYLNGKLHREDGPAIEYANGDKFWSLNGKFQRGEVTILQINDVNRRREPGYTEVIRDKELSVAESENCKGLTMKTYTVEVYDSGNRYWYLNGLRHREDGPAIEYVNCDKRWFLNDIECTEAEFNAKMKSTKELSIGEMDDLFEIMDNLTDPVDELELLQNSKFEFFLGGSRRIAEKFNSPLININENTDYDFYATYSVELEQFLIDNNYQPTETNQDYFDDECIQIYKKSSPDHPEIQIVLRKDAMLYNNVFESIDADSYYNLLWKRSPLTCRWNIQPIFNLMFSVARKCKG